MNPRRRKEDVSDELGRGLARLPWTLIALLMLAVYIVTAAVLPSLMVMHIASNSVSLLPRGSAELVALLPTVVVGLIAVNGKLARRERQRTFDTSQSLDSLRNLSPESFEEWVAEAYIRQGYAVDETSRGADGGVDLVLLGNGEVTYVQCKRWRDAKVDVRRVRELYGVMISGGAQRGVIVTTGAFTTAAIVEAEGKPIQLLSRNDLLRLVAHAPGPKGEEISVLQVGSSAPLCPSCRSRMVVRQARRGANSGTIFWGCPRFPHCRGTREMV